jgi:O-antigen ligase
LVGTGFESFWLGDRLQRVWDLTAQGIQEAHNGYLEVYLNLGWVGITLLAALIVAGYRNVLAVFRRDPDAGRIRLAFLVVGVIYSLTEAGFRMMAPVWTFFLLATIAVPEPAVLESPTQLDMDIAYNFAECESEVDRALGVGFR